MYTSHNTLKISDLRKHTAEVIEDIEKTDHPVFVFSHSQPKIVIMNVQLFQKLNRRDDAPPAPPRETQGLDFFIDPPEEFLIKKKGLDAVKLIRAERD